MRMRLRIPLFAAILAVPSAALASRPADDRARSLELTSGERPRPHVEVIDRAPVHHPAWARFLERAGGRWQAMWDRDTGVPVRIWGSGIDAPESNASAAAAERFARAFLAEHLALLAPGASIDDFVLAGNVLSGGVRSVGFVQTERGIPVASGQLSLRFKKDRLIAIGSEAFPNLSIEPATTRISDAAAVQAALRWTDGRVEKVGEPVIRAVVLEDGRIAASHVIPVIVWTRDPIGRWEVDVELSTGKPFARRQTLMFASGSLRYLVPERHPNGLRVEAPVRNGDVLVDGVSARTAEDGTLSWTSSAAVQVTASVVGPLVRVQDEGGAPIGRTLSLEDGGVAVWDESENDLADAQLTTFIAARRARDYMKRIAPGLGFLDEQLLAFVNIPDERGCNAFSDGTTINFLQGNEVCQNTGRLVDVVIHEYGHSIHAHSIIRGVGSFDDALSEGGADYLAATIANDPGMGRGFFHDEEPLRHVDPDGSEAVWPDDRGEPHVTGLIFAGAMWDLRKYMIDAHGPERGVEITDDLWYGVMQRATSVPTSYVEVLVGDDDDGDLSNGTPNMCDITNIFRAHGLATATQAGLTIGSVALDGWRVELPLTEGNLCPGFEVTSSTMVWELRGHPGVGGTVSMTKSPGAVEAMIPPQPEGEVVRYNVTLEIANGETIRFPNNPADPMYEVFIGETTPIYCTDFETDPLGEGWTSEMISGSGRRARNEWEWGELSEGFGSGDPSAAYSGTHVIGNDLGLEGFGTYQRNKVEQMVSPVIDVSGHERVRLQYRRWLTIEDGDFDQAEILAGGTRLWSNAASGTGEVHHLDREWRFHDVDLTAAAAANGGQVQLTYRLTSDDGLQAGGWTIDDFCLVGWTGPVARCGDGTVDSGETCDDGNTTPGDGCEADCTATMFAMCGNGAVEAGEQCDDGNAAPGDGCDPGCVLSAKPEPQGPKLEEEDSGCACTSVELVTANGPLSLILLLGLLLARRKR